MQNDVRLVYRWVVLLDKYEQCTVSVIQCL
jgi:hypothetical protein